MPRAKGGAVDVAIAACVKSRTEGRGRDSFLAFDIFRSMSEGAEIEYHLVDGSSVKGVARSCGPMKGWKATPGKRASSLVVVLRDGREVRLEDVDSVVTSSS